MNLVNKTPTTMSLHCHTTRPFPAAAKKASGFSLIELLAVVAVIAVLSVMTAPALSSMKARNLVVGGNLVHDLTQQARQNAMTRGALTALVLMKSNPSKTELSNRLFVVMELTPGAVEWTPLTRWCRLPDGVVVDPQQSATFTASPSVGVPLNLPKYEGAEVQAGNCVFQVFQPSGGLMSNSGASTVAASLRLCEGIGAAGGAATVQNSGNYYAVVINPYTGLAKIDRP